MLLGGGEYCGDIPPCEQDGGGVDSRFHLHGQGCHNCSHADSQYADAIQITATPAAQPIDRSPDIDNCVPQGHLGVDEPFFGVKGISGSLEPQAREPVAC